MAERTLLTRLQQKRDASSNWSANNPILLDGEIGVESDTYKIKIGDGTTAWNSLPYSCSSGDYSEIPVATKDVLGGIKLWVSGNTLYISTSKYVNEVVSESLYIEGAYEVVVDGSTVKLS